MEKITLEKILTNNSIVVSDLTVESFNVENNGLVFQFNYYVEDDNYFIDSFSTESTIADFPTSLSRVMELLDTLRNITFIRLSPNLISSFRETL